MKNPVRTNDVRWRTNDVRWSAPKPIWPFIPARESALSRTRSPERGILAFHVKPTDMEKTTMRRVVIFFPWVLFAMFLFAPAAPAQQPGPTIADFKVQALYRAAKLTWNVPVVLKDPVTLKILRAASSADSPYHEVEVVKLVPGKSAYDYVDKSMGAESMYFYKLVVNETGESFGPMATRPYFSPPATQYQPPGRERLFLALVKTGR